MNDQSQLLLRSIKGPIIMITVGVLFAADRFTDYQFHQTWPVLLIVIGLMQLLGGRGSLRRPDYYPPPVPPPAPARPASSQPASSQPYQPAAPSPVVPTSVVPTSEATRDEATPLYATRDESNPLYAKRDDDQEPRP